MNLSLFDHHSKLLEILIQLIVYKWKLNHPSKFYRFTIQRFAENKYSFVTSCNETYLVHPPHVHRVLFTGEEGRFASRFAENKEELMCDIRLIVYIREQRRILKPK